jgi:diguanylate cyclase (GGDEF)-like protein/hemerythrin-like metal-binding protein
MKRAVSVVSLRALMMLLVGLLVVVALLFAAGAWQQSRATFQNATILAERNHVADSCLQAVRNFALERGRSSVLLSDRGPISAENRRAIDARRDVSDTHLGEVFERLPAGSRAKGDQVRGSWEIVATLRPALAHNFALPLNERDPALPGQWLSAANALVAALEALLIDLSNATDHVDAGFDHLSNLRILAMQFSNAVGAEATLLAAELSAGRVPSREVIGATNQLRGRSGQIWSQLEPGVGRLADTHSSAAVARVRASLFGVFRPLQDEIIRAAGSDHRAAMTLNRYQSASASALDAIAELADGISRAADAYTKKRLAQAERQALLALASIAAILVLAGLVAGLLVWRLTRPLKAILARIDKLLRVQSGASSPASSTGGGDEFARVHEALESLDQAMHARLRSEQALTESERISASILACVPQAIIATDVDGLISVFSPGAEDMLGYSAAEMIGKQTPLLFHDPGEVRALAEGLSNELGHAVEPDFNVIVAKTKTRARPDAREWTFVRKDGSRLNVLLSTTSLRNGGGEVAGFLGVATDVTESAQAAARFTHMAHHDQLTLLPNRRLFHDRMQMAITQARRDSSRLALMLIDLDRFKPVNDKHGHAVGDLLLKAVARRMQDCLRGSDTLARIGGDEFVAILAGIGSEDDALGVAEKIRLALNEPFDLAGGYRVGIGCSIGIAICPDHGNDEKHLTKNADDAMYTAKELGRNRVHLFDGVSGRWKKDAPRRLDLALVRLVWHRSYKCGEPSIDAEHHELFDRANALIHAAIADGEGAQPLPLALDELMTYVTRHFANEEAILARYGFAGLADHAVHHQRLSARAAELRRMAAAGELTLGELVTFLAQEVVVKHMLKEDRKFFPLLRSGGSPVDAAVRSAAPIAARER